MRKTTVAALATVLIAVTACGSDPKITGGGPAIGASEGAVVPEPGADPTPTVAAPVAAKLGEKLTVSSETLGATYLLSKQETKAADEFDQKPENGMFLLVFLRVDVIKGEMFACSCELSFVEADGRVREEVFASFKSRPKLVGTDLKAGQNTDGWVVFDVKKDAVKGGRVQLKVASLLSESQFGYWQV